MARDAARPAGGAHRPIVSQALRGRWECAITELSALGIGFDPNWREQLDRTLEGARQAKARRRAEKEAARARTDTGLVESDETFAYIAGYTDGGAAFGVTWEKWERIERGARREPPKRDGMEQRDDESLPF